MTKKQFIYKDKNIKVYYLADREYKTFDKVREQIWHREDGPALIFYYENGEVRIEDYWVNGKELTEEEFKRYQLVRNTKIGKELYD